MERGGDIEGEVMVKFDQLTPMLRRVYPRGMTYSEVQDLLDRIHGCLEKGWDHEEGGCSLYKEELLGRGVNPNILSHSKRYLQVDIGKSHYTGDRVREYGHRLICWARWGPIKVARHICPDAGGHCLNPLHLLPSSIGDNTRDAVALRCYRKRLCSSL